MSSGPYSQESRPPLPPFPGFNTFSPFDLFSPLVATVLHPPRQGSWLRPTHSPTTHGDSRLFSGSPRNLSPYCVLLLLTCSKKNDVATQHTHLSLSLALRSTLHRRGNPGPGRSSAPTPFLKPPCARDPHLFPHRGPPTPPGPRSHGFRTARAGRRETHAAQTCDHVYKGGGAARVQT